MITFKQIDALYWIAELGSFEAAANKLNMSQSAISKRIQELEETFDVEIFDRSKRNARLTEKGAELLDYAKDLLERRDYLLERVSTRGMCWWVTKTAWSPSPRPTPPKYCARRIPKCRSSRRWS